MAITCRPARSEDLEDAERVVHEAMSALRVRHGLKPPGAPPTVAFPEFCRAEDPDGLWVAEDAGAIVGFGFSWISDGLWCLSQLFVSPAAQAKGVGQALLSKTLLQAERNGATNRVIITFAYNVASTGLYLNNGVYPVEPLYRMAASAESVAQRLAHVATDGGYVTTPIAPWPESRDWTGQIDQALLGFRRDLHHRFLLGGVAARAIRIERMGSVAGYAYISAEGHVGPLAIAAGADAAAVVTTALRAALENSPAQVSLIVPGRADAVMRTVLALGFRLREPYVLMASRPFGDWCRYLPRNPGFL